MTRHHRHRAVFVVALSSNALSSLRAAAAPEHSSLDQHGNSFQDLMWPVRQLCLGYSLQGGAGTHPNALRVLGG